MCRDFLLTGECQAGDDCDLSHDPSPERVPACLHFSRGNCTNSSCRFAHVRTNPKAPVCRAFATLGFCPRGASCTDRHVHECPDYANKGTCRNKKCRLPHTDRAGQLRKAAAAVATPGASDDENTTLDLSSDDDNEDNSDDVDSDDFEEEMVMGNNASHEMLRQSDFVHF